MVRLGAYSQNVEGLLSLLFFSFLRFFLATQLLEKTMGVCSDLSISYYDIVLTDTRLLSRLVLFR